MFHQILHLLRKEILLEIRQRSALAGILLYVVSTVFVCYLSFKQLVSVPAWNALFWIIVLFAAFNAITRSFSKESKGERLFDYLLAHPRAVILAKTLFNAALLLIMTLLSFGVYSLFLGSGILSEADWSMLGIALLLGGIGFATTLTMIGAIASRTNNNIGLIAILGFPVILPMLTTLLRLSKSAIDGLSWSVVESDILVLVLLNIIVVTLSLLLFPYLWRE